MNDDGSEPCPPLPQVLFYSMPLRPVHENSGPRHIICKDQLGRVTLLTFISTDCQCSDDECPFDSWRFVQWKHTMRQFMELVARATVAVSLCTCPHAFHHDTTAILELVNMLDLDEEYASTTDRIIADSHSYQRPLLE